jgi:hypothetical protein
MEFLQNHNLLGLTIGIFTFIVIGLFHPLVIKSEYYLGTKVWWIFLVMGVVGIVFSVITANLLISAISGVFAFSSFWSIKELFEQRERVKKGWFPANPKRNNSTKDKSVQ